MLHLQARGYQVFMVLEHEVTGRMATVRIRKAGRKGEPLIADLLFASSGIEAELVDDSHVYRYRPELAAQDGLAGSEGTFCICSFWYAECLARSGDLQRARYAFDWNRQFELAIDPEHARRLHDETLPDEYFKSAEFCSMCGPKFCSMHVNRDVEKYVATLPVPSPQSP